jgi:PAS domain S-box-containing protein
MINKQTDSPKGDILIVDDDLPSLNTLSSMLTNKGYEVRGVPDGPMALTVIETKPPELVLLDVKMPGMDGFEVCRQIKANEEASGIPVLFLSALDETADKVKGFAAGGLDFITKPFQAEEVLARVDTHLTLSRLRRNLEEQVVERTAKLKESEERYRLLVEAAPVSIMAIRNGCILFANPAGTLMLGFSDPAEMIGIPAMDIVAPESQQLVAERIKQLENGKDNPTAEIVLIRQDGSRIIVESISVSIRIDGIPTAVVIAQDISDRKKKEEKLQMMQFSIDNALDRIAWIAPDGRLLYANRATCEEMGYTLEEVLTMSIPDVDSNFTAERWAEHFQEVRKNGSILFETQNISGDGKIHDVEVSTNYFKFDNNEFLCAFARDITERKQLDLKLKESQARFRAFMDNIPAAVYIKDENDRHIYGNREAFKAVKKKPDEFIGSNTRDLWPPQMAERLIELDQKVLNEEIPRITEEFRNTKIDDMSWRRDIKFPIKLECGKKLLGGIALDITKIKQNEQKLRDAYNEIEQLKEKLEQECIYLREEIEVNYRHEEIIGKSKLVMEMLNRAEQVAETDSTVLILGETGTGKELLARSIHKLSSRKNRQVVKVNCAALPATLIESELFGRERGAYTGAMTRQIGRFEIADGSTIFLDEIGELPLDVQAKLLRVLQEGQFERLGNPQTISVDVRIIASTNRDLAKVVSEGKFREDLYYRLNVFPITVPPLRDRIEDISLLVWALVKEFEKSMGKTIEKIPQTSIDALYRYPWPGNIRELRNVIENAMIISKEKILKLIPHHRCAGKNLLARQR